MIVAVIPFRANSKGVPGKNTRLVAGKPLWVWSLEAAERARCVDRIIITTDIDRVSLFNRTGIGALDQLYTSAGISLRTEYIQRPAELATDTATLDEVLIHAADASVPRLPDDAIIMLLQPTVPVRRPGLLDDCSILFSRFPAAKSLLTANPLHYIWHGDSGRLLNPPRRNRQDMSGEQRYFHEDGSVFMVRAGDLRATGSRVVEPVVLFETEQTVDIDTEADMRLAASLLSCNDGTK
jgi:N-acylneuraminate cytidylyltransferase